MRDGFYWGTLINEINGINAGVIFVKDGIGHLHGIALLITAYDFGDNPEPITPPDWLIDYKKDAKET